MCFIILLIVIAAHSVTEVRLYRVKQNKQLGEVFLNSLLAVPYEEKINYFLF